MKDHCLAWCLIKIAQLNFWLAIHHFDRLFDHFLPFPCTSFRPSYTISVYLLPTFTQYKKESKGKKAIEYCWSEDWFWWLLTCSHRTEYTETFATPVHRLAPRRKSLHQLMDWSDSFMAVELSKWSSMYLSCFIWSVEIEIGTFSLIWHLIWRYNNSLSICTSKELDIAIIVVICA